MIYLVFPSRASFDQFKAEFPSTLADPDTLLGEPSPLSTLEDGTPEPDSQWIVAHHFTADEAAMLQMAGADVRVGNPDGPEFGSEEAAP